MSTIPVIGFSAWSGTGKTTLIEKLIGCFKEKGIRVAVIKHDAHSFEIDREGKDSWRFSQAGAAMTVLASAEKAVFMEQRPLDFQELIAHVHDVDLILAEGYNQEDIPRIGLSRRATGRGFRLPVSSYIALITDIPQPSAACPVFAPDDIEGIAQFLLEFTAVKS